MVSRVTPSAPGPVKYPNGGILRPTGRVGPGGVIHVGPPQPVDPPQPPPPQPIVQEWERNINISGTILDRTIPSAYGTSTVTGFIGASYYNSTTKNLDLGVVFAYGEQNSISTSTTYINGEVITSAAGVSSEAVHTGDGTTALSSILTSMPSWSADDTTLWKTLAHAVMRISCTASNIPNNFVFTSKLGGRKCVPIGGGTAAVSSNPAVIAYDIATSADWAEIATARIDETSFGAFEDWCDETMSDSSKRYAFNGALAERDPWQAMSVVLGHGLAYPYITSAGKLAVWADMMPAAITGEWSASASATITEDSTAGEATTELTAGDYVYVGTNLRRVSSITDDDTVVLDSAVTVSGVSVRPISNVYIKKHDWVAPPAASEMNLLQTPDEYRLRFTDEDNAGSHEVLVQYGSGTTKIVETQLVGCTKATHATRIGETYLKVAHLEPFFWSGVVGNAIGTLLEPGDVVLFDDDLLTMQAARVLPPIQARADGTYVLQLREFDPSAYSDETETTDTPPNIGTAWASANIPIVTGISSVYSGTEYDSLSYDGSGRQVFGDSGTASTLSASSVRLPNNVPLYGLNTSATAIGLLMMNSSDEIELGDSSYPLYFTGSSFYLPREGMIKGGSADDVDLVHYSYANNEIRFGADTSDPYNVTVRGDTVKLDAVYNVDLAPDSGYSIRMLGTTTFPGSYSIFDGVGSKAGLPSTSDIASGHWAFYYNTSDGTMGCFFNVSGTIVRVS